MDNQELLESFFQWLVDEEVAGEGYDARALAIKFLREQEINAQNARARAAERNLEKVARANSGFPEARR